MTVYKPPGYRNSQSTSGTREATWYPEHQCRQVSVSCPQPGGEEGPWHCRRLSFAAVGERMLKLKPGPEEEVPCFGVLATRRGP